jgi:hypothetical protein
MTSKLPKTQHGLNRMLLFGDAEKRQNDATKKRIEEKKAAIIKALDDLPFDEDQEKEPEKKQTPPDESETICEKKHNQAELAYLLESVGYYIQQNATKLARDVGKDASILGVFNHIISTWDADVDAINRNNIDLT